MGNFPSDPSCRALPTVAFPRDRKEGVQANEGDWLLLAELVGNGNLFLLQVTDAAILNGDWVPVGQTAGRRGRRDRLGHD